VEHLAINRCGQAAKGEGGIRGDSGSKVKGSKWWHEWPDVVLGLVEHRVFTMFCMAVVEGNGASE
jgi:hypothetical protein